MSRNIRGWMYVLFAVLIMCITLGYAYLNTELDINGTTNITSANWNIYWDNIQYGSNNVTDVTTPATISSGLTEVTFNVNFKEPGDTYEFTVDAVNDGTINAMVSVVTSGVYAANGTTPKTLPDYLEYNITYSDGTTIASKHLLEAGSTKTYKVLVHYKEDISSSQLPSTNDNYVFKFGIDYVQADVTAIDSIPSPVSFLTDSWETIANAVKKNNVSAYHVGDTKEIDLGSLGTHTLRIANTTTPVECSTEGFSQTACGFVLEFEDIITEHAYCTTNSNGSWRDSEIRRYLNDEIYNILPRSLKESIMDVRVVTGHNSNENDLFITTDKIYLLSITEILYPNSTNGFKIEDSAFNYTRQTDYYAANVTCEDSAPLACSAKATKTYNGETAEYILTRSPRAYSSSSVFNILKYGNWNGKNCQSETGISPAFRIG